MDTIYDLLRHLVEHATWPVDEARQEAHDLLDRLENLGDEHLAGNGQDVTQDTAKADAADTKKAPAVSG